MTSSTKASEQAVLLQGSQGPMIGVLSLPPGACRAALVIVAGQPQTRVGSHRMFTELSRHLVNAGVATLRFDAGGWGDSPGEPRPFEASVQDIVLATRAMKNAVPTTCPIGLWGLCDGASSAVLALPMLKQAGLGPTTLFLINPWVRSDASHSAAIVNTYYRRRLFDRELWLRLLTGKIPLKNLVFEPLRHLRARFLPKVAPSSPSEALPSGAPLPSSAPAASKAGNKPPPKTGPSASTPDLPQSLMHCLMAYQGKVFTILAGNDLTAGETESLLKRETRWRDRLERSGEILRIADADHTFTHREHWLRVIAQTADRAAG